MKGLSVITGLIIANYIVQAIKDTPDYSAFLERSLFQAVAVFAYAVISAVWE